MDLKLQLLRRQAQASGDWATYAHALERLVHGDKIDDQALVVWVAESYHLETGRHTYYLFLTQEEAVGQQMNMVLDEIGEISYEEGETDPDWYQNWETLVKAVESGHYFEAMKLWDHPEGPALVQSFQEFIQISTDCYPATIQPCSPDHPPPTVAISSDF